MRIVHVINYFQPKLGYQETFLAREQAKMGHDVFMVASDRYYPFPDFEKTYGKLLGKRKCGAGFREEEGIKTYRLATPVDVKCRVWLIGLENLVANLKPDLVISHAVLSNSFRLAKMKSKGHNFKLIVDDHMDIFARKDLIGRLYYSWKKKRIKKYLVPWVDRFVGVSRSTCDFLENENGVPKEKIVYIPLGSDDDMYRFDEGKRRKMRQELQVADDSILFLCTGKFNLVKGVDVLVKAFNALKTNRETRLLLVGEGTPEFKEQLTGMLDGEKKNKLVFHPFVPATELPAYFCAADACVWAKETSTSMLDAASCRRPFIGCDIASVRERLANENGFAYETGNCEDLAAKMKLLCENGKLREEMGKRGRELIEKEFSWKIIGKKFIDCVK